VIEKWRAIDKKWQEKWVKERAYRAVNPGEIGFNSNKKSFYVLDMFPYPSGSGLHMGHASGYIGTDIVARKKHMEGFNVLHPMGWDAFGLPAEQYAIQTGQHPRVTTDKNTANFRRQLQNLGLSYDWDREIDTSHPTYYKWTQWIFLQLYKKGLVYRKEMPVWWCEELKSVLANEEVINGRSERGSYPCERRPLTQWIFKITEYADKLLADLDELDWPESVKKMQRDWVGRSLGARIQFQVEDSSYALEVFSTRPDTLFGVVALVIAPEHKMVDKITTLAQRETVILYRDKTRQKSDRDRKAEGNQITACFTGGKVIHPLTNELVPVYIGDYVLADYGTGAVMVVPAHDERDYLLAKAIGLPIKQVIEAPGRTSDGSCYVEDGILFNSGEFNRLTSEEARKKIVRKLEQLNKGQPHISYKMRDWIFSRQRYWGEPFPLLLDERDAIVLVEEVNLPVTLPDMNDFEPNTDGSSPLTRVRSWFEVNDKSGRKLRRVTDTMPGWAGSCWYYLRFMDSKNSEAPFSKEAVQYWSQVDLYVGGASHAVMHLLYARFWHKVLYDIGLVPTKEPFKKLFNQGMVTAFAFKDAAGRLVPTDEVTADSSGSGWVRTTNGQKVERFISKMAKSLRNVVNPDDVIEAKGCDVVRLYQMFMGPLADDKPWDDVGLSGCENFLKRLWGFIFDDFGKLKIGKREEAKNWKALHKTLKRVNESFAHFNFNTAVAGFMECLNDLKDTGVPLNQSQLEMLIKVMHPFAPHITSEIWELLGYKTWLHHEAWPELNTSYLVETDFELVFQVNGKIRKRKMVPANINESEVWTLAQSELEEHLVGKAIIKQIYVPRKLCNIVVKG